MTATPPRFLSLSVAPWGLLLAAGVVCSACSFLGYLGRFHWYLDLYSHFRFQYVWILGLIGIVLLAGHHRRAGFIFLVIAALSLPPILLPFLEFRSIPNPDAPRLRAVLINVNSRQGDPVRVRQFIEDIEPDLIVLEEYSSRWAELGGHLSRPFPGRLIIPREDNFGIALFTRIRLARIELVEIGNAELPSIMAVLRTPFGPLRVIATHPPPPLTAEYTAWRNRQLEDLAARAVPGDPLILLGDLNTTPWNHAFRNLVRRSGLRDSTRGFGLQPTWPDYLWPFRIPLDHCLHSGNITIINRRIGPDVASDHRPLIVDFAMPTLGTHPSR